MKRCVSFNVEFWKDVNQKEGEPDGSQESLKPIKANLIRF